MKDVLERAFSDKEKRRLALARLPYEEKVRMVVRLQEMQAPILRARGQHPRVWRLPPDTSTIKLGK